jgi:hypothetical protein
LIIALGYLVYIVASWWYHSGRTRSITGVPEPVQSNVTSEEIRFEKNGWNIIMNYKCSYDIQALVVHTKEYDLTDNMGDAISPVDLLLAWGRVAEKNEEIDFDWSQSNRGGRCVLTDSKLSQFGGDMASVIMQFSNNHIIPAEENVRKDLLRVRRGDHIRIRGYLVNIDGVRKSDGASSYWYSSTVRDDYVDGEGGQGCEVVYVTNVDWIDD